MNWGCLRRNYCPEYVNLRERKQHENEDDDNKMWSIIIGTQHPILYG
jgi:hypothetical protein